MSARREKFGRILIIDTDETQCLLIKTWLGLRGFDVTVAADLAEGMRLLAAEYEAVICADNLPGMSPEAFLHWWQEINPQGFVIFMGREERSERLLELIAQGAFTYIQKPVMEEKLVQALSQGRQNHQVMLGILQLTEELKEAYLKLQRQAEILEEKRLRQQEQSAELNFITSCSYAMTTTLDPAKLAGTVARELKSLVKFSFFSLDWFHLPEERVVFLSPGLTRQGQELFLASCGDNDDVAWPPGEGEPVFQVIASPNEAVRLARPPRYQRLFPLELGGRTLGVMVLGDDIPLELSLAKRKMLRSLGPYMALAMNNAMEHHRLRNLAEYDDLTQVYNRRMFEEHLKREVVTSHRYNYPVSLMLIDVDLFKEINDSYGHQTGDAVLQKIAGILRREVRQTDLLARFGGDEFALILPHTPAKKAKVLAKRLLRRLAQERFANGTKLKVTVSIGIANNQTATVADENDLVFQADKALYLAKARGRNNLVVMDQVKSTERPPLGLDPAPLHGLKLPTPL